MAVTEEPEPPPRVPTGTMESLSATARLSLAIPLCGRHVQSVRGHQRERFGLPATG